LKKLTENNDHDTEVAPLTLNKVESFFLTRSYFCDEK
jgi:hypothetical protein